MSLFQYTPTGTSSVVFVNSLALPGAPSGANFPVVAEYGSSSEGNLNLSGQGHYLTLMGYGVRIDDFNAHFLNYGGVDQRLAQSSSLTGNSSFTPVPRVLALVDANGHVNSTTAVYNIYNLNNPRSAFTATGATAYLSGQGSGSDATGGVFFTPVGAVNTAPTAITGLDTTSKTIAQDTRDIQILNNTLYVSVDSKEGSGSNRDFIGTLGNPPATSLFNNGNGPTQLTNFATSGAGKWTIGSSPNTGNNLNAGLKINLSPQAYFFAAPNVLYVADTGNPKNDSNGDNNANQTASIGNGGLQKWVNSQSNGSGSWNLVYTLYQGLNIIDNSNASGTSGLYGLAGVVNGANVNLYATNATLSDLDQTNLYGITDVLANTTPPGTSLAFTLLEAAPADSNFKGVSFAPSIPAGDVEILTSPSGLNITTVGTGCAPGTYAAPRTLAWTPSSNCSLQVASPQAGTTGVQYAFNHWDDSSTTTSRSVTAPSQTASYTATFDTDYLLTTAAGTGGSISAGGYFLSGSTQSVTATPDSASYFVNFTGDVSSTSNPLQLQMTQPYSVTANFAPKTTPTVTWNAPAAIAYGSALSGIELNATASVPGAFTYNPPAGTVLAAGANQTLSASFTPTDTVHYNNASGSTTITVNPPSSGGSPANLVVTKVLSRNGASIFVQLTVANTGGTDAQNVVVSSVKVGSATASPLPQTIGTIAAGSSATVTVSVPSSVGASGAGSSLTVAGTYTGGTFSLSSRITLP
jgi:hypothetical protein